MSVCPTLLLTDFRQKYDDKQQALTNRIIDARKRLKTVDISYDFRVKISQVCTSAVRLDQLQHPMCCTGLSAEAACPSLLQLIIPAESKS